MKKFKTSFRVRYAETDQMRVVYYGNYFVWFEVARTEALREMGIEYSELEKEGYFLMVADARCQYKAPCKYDDLIIVHTEICEVKNSSLSFDYQIFKNDKLLAIGKTAHVFCNTEGRPVRIPLKVREKIENVSKPR
ncbi:MAG: thioesterase family protein [Candidatus Omnitrophota bacterium]